MITSYNYFNKNSKIIPSKPYNYSPRPDNYSSVRSNTNPSFPTSHPKYNIPPKLQKSPKPQKSPKSPKPPVPSNQTNIKKVSSNTRINKNNIPSNKYFQGFGMINKNNHTNKENINILWSSNTIQTLRIIMKYINTHSLMQPIGHMVRYYINKHQPYDEEYKILTVGNVSETINRDVLILAYVCEIRIKKKKKKNIIVTNKRIYSTLGEVINEVIDDIFRYDSWEPNYEEIFMINTISEMIGTSTKTNTRDLVTSAYHLTKRVITYIELSNNHIITYTETLFLRTQDLDISFLTPHQIREFTKIFRTKRRLYLRIFLVLAYHLIRENSVITRKWISNVTNIKNQEDLVNMLNNLIIELIITITGYGIKISD